MATRIYAINVGERYVDVRENVGPTGTSATIALVVDLATTAVNEGSTTRGAKRSEVLLALEYLQQYLLKINDPPA